VTEQDERQTSDRTLATRRTENPISMRGILMRRILDGP
jgi:hypothetical protein